MEMDEKIKEMIIILNSHLSHVTILKKLLTELESIQMSISINENNQTVFHSVVYQLLKNILEVNKANLLNLENGLYTSSEILSRSGFEHAVNLLLIINDECYLKSFVLDYHKTKIKSADFWKLYAQKQGNTNLEIAAENRIEQLKLSLNILSIQDSDSKKLPKIYERFEKIGMEAAYHNLYAPSCDAVHALMEDVANFLIATKIKTKDKQNLNVAEKKSYAIYMSINSVQFYYKTLYAYMVFYNVIDIYMLKMEDVNQQLTALLSIHENDNLDLI